MCKLIFTITHKQCLSNRAAIQLLFELLDVGGYLVVLEAGNPHGSHSARTARQFVLDVFNNVDRKGQFTATPIYPTSNTAKDEDDEEDEYSDPSKEKVKRSKKPQ